MIIFRNVQQKMSGDGLIVLFFQVREDPGDFTGWTYLLQHVDSKNDLEAGRYLSTQS